MGYRIDYGAGKAQAGKSHKIWLWFVDLTLLFTAVICLWPEARTAAAKLLLSGSAEKIVLTAEAFAQELRGERRFWKRWKCSAREFWRRLDTHEG